MQQKRPPALRPAPPTTYLDEGSCTTSALEADRYGNKFLDHWFCEDQERTSLPELKALAQLLRCNADDWGKEEFASNCLKTALGLSRQVEHVWPGLYQLAALIKERGYYKQDIESWERKKTLYGKETFEEWFCEYIHPSFEAFTRMESQFKLAEQTGAPLPRTINLDGLSTGQQVKVAQAAEGYGAAAAVLEETTAPVGRPAETTDNIRNSDNSYGTSGADTYRRIQKLAREGNQQAAGLLDQIDRGETNPHAAYISLGLRRPQITVQLEPDLHDQLKAYTERTGDKTREVVADALELFFRRMSALEDQTPEPSPAVVPAAIALDLLGDVASTPVPFQGQQKALSFEGQPDLRAEELKEIPLGKEATHSRTKKPRPPAPDYVDLQLVSTTEAVLIVDLSKQSIHSKRQKSTLNGVPEVWIDSPDPRFKGVKLDLRTSGDGRDFRWRVHLADAPAKTPDLDQPRGLARPTEFDEVF